MSLTSYLLANRTISFDGMVSPETCRQLYSDMTKNATFNESQVSSERGAIDATEDTNFEYVKHKGRVSDTAFFQSFTAESSATLKDLTELVCDYLGVNPNRVEPWQCTRYFTGGFFDYHDDCGNWATNERLYTVMLTLKAPRFGGQTHFQRLERTYPSQEGRLLIWRNLDERNRCDGLSIHAGAPVGIADYADEKMIIVTWIRVKEYVA